MEEINNNMNNESSKPVVKKKSKWWLKILIIVGIVIIVGSILGLIKTNSTPVDVVKGGTFDDYPNTTIGKAFDKFFANPKWESFKNANNDQVVKFKGGASLDEKSVTLDIMFLIKESRFEVMWFAIDGKEETADEFNEWMKVVFKK